MYNAGTVQEVLVREIGLSGFLREQRAAIISAWAESVRTMSSAKTLSTPALLDHIPGFIDHIAGLAATRSPKAAKPAAHDAVAHAVQRLEQGFDLEQVTHEYALLRKVIYQRLRADRLSLPTAEQELLDGAIDMAIRRAVSGYAAAERQILGAIDRVSAAAAGTADVGEMLSRIIQVFIEAAGPVDTVTLLLPEDGHLRARASIGLDDAVARGYSVPIGEGFAGTIAKTGQALALDDAAHDPLIRDEALRRRGIKALYGVPLLQGGRVIGVAQMGSRSATAFSEEQQVLFRAITSHAATLIALALAVTRERAASLAARAFAMSATVDDAMARLLAGLGDAFGWTLGSYWQVDSADGVLRHHLSWAAEEAEAAVLEELTRGFTFAPGEGLPGRAWQSGVVEWVTSIAHDERLPRKAVAAAKGLQSGVAFPVSTGSDVLGVLEFFGRTVHPIAEEAVEMTSVISRQLPEFLRRIQAQENQRRSDAQRSAILDVALDCIISMDAGGVVTGWNPAAERTFGYSADDAIGHDLAELIIPPELREGHRSGLARYLSTGQHAYLDRRLEVPALRRDGARLTVELAITQVPGVRPPLFTGFLRDITAEQQAALERARLHQEAEDASQARDMMMAIVSHDLRNPMAAIMAATGLIVRRTASNGDPSVRRSLETIVRASTQVDRLIADLLDTSSIQAGRLSIARTPHDIASIICDATDLHRPAAAERGVDLTCESVPREIEGRWDRNRIHQVLSNLIGNGIKFCRPGDSIRVRAEAQGTRAVVEVADSGPGIAPTELAHIFEPYWTRRRATTNVIGTGLGLFIARGIVEAHGGELTVDSSVGRGTTFRFRLPLDS